MLDLSSRRKVLRHLVLGAAAMAVSAPVMAIAGDAPAIAAQAHHNGQWVAPAGASLREILNTWASLASPAWQEPIWNSEYDYRLRATATFEGDFATAAADLVDSLGRDYPELRAEFYANRVVIIKNALASK